MGELVKQEPEITASHDAHAVLLLRRLKAYFSANFLGLADRKDHQQEYAGCETCGGWSETIEGSEGMSMEKIGDVIEKFIKEELPNI